MRWRGDGDRGLREFLAKATLFQIFHSPLVNENDSYENEGYLLEMTLKMIIFIGCKGADLQATGQSHGFELPIGMIINYMVKEVFYFQYQTNLNICNLSRSV